jgi:hypothetical protein
LRIIAGLCISLTISVAADAQTASVYYQSRYHLSGLLLRASAVCGGDWKRTVDAAFNLISTPELKAISKAYPDTTEQWLKGGADNFNTGVMTDGLAKACAFALTARSKVEATVKSDRAGVYARPPAPAPTAAPPPVVVPGPAPKTPIDSVPIYVQQGREAQVDVQVGTQIQRMVIDTGATDMSLPWATAMALINKGEADYGPKEKVKIADGSVIERWTIVIHRVSIGSHVLTDVKAGVVANGADALLPFPILTKFGKVTIDAENGRLIFG